MTGAARQKKNLRNWKRSKSSVGLVGAGRVGSALLLQLKKKHYPVVGIYDKKSKKSRECYRLLKLKYQRMTLEAVASHANLIFIATPDREISGVYLQLYRYLKPKTFIAHLSGAFSSDIFKKKKGVHRLSIHPIQTFPGLQSALTSLPGSFISLEGDAKAIKVGKKIVRDLSGQAILIPKKFKPLYHTMCVFATNFLVVLLNRAEKIGHKLRLKNPMKNLMPMVKQTIANIEKLGTVKSLSGPVERGEVAVVRAHLKALKKYAPELLDLYLVITHHALSLAQKKSSGAIYRTQLKNLKRLVQN